MAAAPGIERYVNRLRRSERRGRLLSILTRDGLVLLIALLSVEALRPTALSMAGAMVLVWLSLRLLVALFSPLSILPQVDHALGLRDELATWSSADMHTRESVMFGWLSRSLDRRLDSLPVERIKEISRVSLGRLRYLLPLVILLLLLRLLAPLMPPLPAGVMNLRNAPGGASGGGGAESQQGSAAAPEPDPALPDRDPSEETPPPPEGPLQPETPQPDAGEEKPPEPIIEDIPEDESFLLPSFIGDGESRPGQAPSGGLDEGPRGGNRSAPSGNPEQSASPDMQRQYERALERALRSRHVPKSERPFVRRYFEALMRRGR